MAKVEQATGLCRAATRRSERKNHVNFSVRLFPIATSFPFRPASGRTVRASRPCYHSNFGVWVKYLEQKGFSQKAFKSLDCLD